MAQTHEGYGVHGAPPPYTEDAKISSYARQYNASELDPHDRPASRHSSVGQGHGRAPSDASSYSTQPQPIGEAVSTAFDKAHIDGIDPNLIAQITQSVIQQLNQNNPSATSKANFPPPPLPQAPHSPPSTHSGVSPPPMPRNVYTPPSPQKHGEFSTRFGSPESRISMPGEDRTSPTAVPEPERGDKRPPSQISDHGASPPTRPRAMSRQPTVEETTLERIWGKLFDAEGLPTPRLGQFLRGLAVHMIEDYEPKCSLVVTPDKLLKFYEDMRLPHEAYPWSIMFDDTQSSVSRMYRDLECQHHLVQEPEHLYEKPDIPGLTPHGFEAWATMMIRAHPDDEFDRLQKAALALPVNNPDDKKERFPKKIPRRLFPSTPDLKLRSTLVQAIEKHCRVNIETSSASSDTSRAPPTQREASPPRSEASFTSDPPYAPSNIERERNPYSSAPSDCAIEDFSTTTSQPIERERNPYSVAPGGGRQYDGEGRPVPPPTQEARSPVPPPPAGPPPSGPPSGPPKANIHRSGSTAQSRPINIPGPPPPVSRPNDYLPESYQGMPHRPSVSTRHRVPSPINEFGRRSEPDVRNGGFTPSSYSSSALDNDYEDDRRYARRPSPGRRYERADTIDPRDNRRSMYDTGEEWYRARSNTTGGRNY